MSHSTLQQQADQARALLAQLAQRDEDLKPKYRLAIPPQPMPTQDPLTRRRNTREVALGYAPEQARLEALRCLQCKNAPCVAGCPVRINIPGFIQAIVDGDFQRSVDIIKEVSLLPAVCGRVCPQEGQCQLPCTVGKVLKDVNQAVSIGRLERFVADWEREQDRVQIPPVKPETGRKVAVLGSGPAGITVAADVRRAGHAVTVFEAFHKAGGVMVYGIPEFRLPKVIVQKEVETLEKMGVTIQTNFVVGRTRKLLDLMAKDGFEAIFIGVGAGLPRFMNIPGENLVGVF
ncbi:MAG: FAD-dependent oxidoreductase, partial [Kiritimatiellaeota bacterium]|nr:FAD-dependent oxidoreductase [Kiritimatiellota bacterium]